jgi:hypothetical protein
MQAYCIIEQCLLDPIEIRKSSTCDISPLYYIVKSKDRYFCVVIKICHDGNFISTAYTTIKIKRGELIYRKGV